MLERLDAWDPAGNARFPRILDYLERLATAPRALVIHGNYLTPGDIEFLADRSERTTVVYCPRTHAYFGHDDYPLADMLAAGVAIALGTDSRASNPNLNLLEEMKFAVRRHPAVSPETILALGTLAGARALGLEKSAGSLEIGKQASFVVVGRLEPGERDPYQALLSPATQVIDTWIDGESVSKDQPPLTAGSS